MDEIPWDFIYYTRGITGPSCQDLAAPRIHTSLYDSVPLYLILPYGRGKCQP
jgi:hypothetical protein